MKKITVILIVAIMLVGCSQDMQKETETELIYLNSKQITYVHTNTVYEKVTTNDVIIRGKIVKGERAIAINKGHVEVDVSTLDTSNPLSAPSSIITLTPVKITEVLKGDYCVGDIAYIVQDGGIVEPYALKFYPYTTYFEKNDDYIVFGHDIPKLGYIVINPLQSFVKVIDETLEFHDSNNVESHQYDTLEEYSNDIREVVNDTKEP